MSGAKLFLDTNILIYFLRGDQDVVNMISDKDIVISFITELELLSFPSSTIESDKAIKGLLANCFIFNITQEIKDLTLELRKKSKLKLPDAIIAATAFCSKLPLLTADKHFVAIEELSIILYEA